MKLNSETNEVGSVDKIYKISHQTKLLILGLLDKHKHIYLGDK